MVYPPPQKLTPTHTPQIYTLTASLFIKEIIDRRGYTPHQIILLQKNEHSWDNWALSTAHASPTTAICTKRTIYSLKTIAAFLNTPHLATHFTVMARAARPAIRLRTWQSPSSRRYHRRRAGCPWPFVLPGADQFRIGGAVTSGSQQG